MRKVHHLANIARRTVIEGDESPENILRHISRPLDFQSRQSGPTATQAFGGIIRGPARSCQCGDIVGISAGMRSSVREFVIATSSEGHRGDGWWTTIQMGIVSRLREFCKEPRGSKGSGRIGWIGKKSKAIEATVRREGAGPITCQKYEPGMAKGRGARQEPRAASAGARARKGAQRTQRTKMSKGVEIRTADNKLHTGCLFIEPSEQNLEIIEIEFSDLDFALLIAEQPGRNACRSCRSHPSQTQVAKSCSHRLQRSYTAQHLQYRGLWQT
ncbi:hypothetical protein C8R46DRAFT_1283968 [Mycena filopes]|nr:hypothetical protein C8R46DRAFT_1283968 [Mycena filopes]